MNRKAQSEVITTFALILIVLAAIGIVWYIVSQFMPGPNDCVFCCSDIVLKMNQARSSDGGIEIQRKAGGEGIIKSVKIVVNGEIASIQSVNGVYCSDDPALLPPNEAYEDLGNPADPADDELDNPIPECEEVGPDGRTALSLEQIETKTYFVPFGCANPGCLRPEAVVNIAAIIDNNGEEKVCDIVDRKSAI